MGLITSLNAEYSHPSFFISGGTGTGKTTFVAEIAEHLPKKTLFLDVDGKLSSQTNITPAQRAKIDIWAPEKKQDLAILIRPKDAPAPDNTYIDLIKVTNEIGKIPADIFPYSAVCLDTYTTLGERMEDYLTILNGGNWNFDLWRAVGRNWRNYLRSIRSLPCMTFVLGHASNEKDELTGAITTVPAMSSNARNTVPKDFTEVLYFKGTGDGKSMSAITLATARYTARSGLPGVRHPEDTLENIKRAIIKHVTSSPSNG